MNGQYSQKLSDILTYSREEANRLHCDYIGAEHLLLAIFRDGNNLAVDLLVKLHTDLLGPFSQLQDLFFIKIKIGIHLYIHRPCDVAVAWQRCNGMQLPFPQQ